MWCVPCVASAWLLKISSQEGSGKIRTSCPSVIHFLIILTYYDTLLFRLCTSGVSTGLFVATFFHYIHSHLDCGPCHTRLSGYSQECLPFTVPRDRDAAHLLHIGVTICINIVIIYRLWTFLFWSICSELLNCIFGHILQLNILSHEYITIIEVFSVLRHADEHLCGIGSRGSGSSSKSANAVKQFNS